MYLLALGTLSFYPTFRDTPLASIPVRFLAILGAEPSRSPFSIRNVPGPDKFLAASRIGASGHGSPLCWVLFNAFMVELMNILPGSTKHFGYLSEGISLFTQDNHCLSQVEIGLICAMIAFLCHS